MGRDHVMRHFKLPLIVTGVALALTLILGIVTVTWIDGSPLSNRQKEQRAQRLGTGAAAVLCVVVAPFWLASAARLGKQRRASGSGKRRSR
jgi:hypothetical protein